MAHRLIIVGAGGFGRELLAWAEDANVENEANGLAAWSAIAFLDQNRGALEPYGIDHRVIGDPLTYQPESADRFACAIGSPSAKLDICRSLRDRGAEFTSVIHPTATVGPRCSLGRGVVLCPYATVTVDAVLGDFVMLNVAARVGHDAKIGDGCTLSGGCDVTGGARLGEGVFMGTNSSLLPGAWAGDHATIAAGSIVYRRAAAGTTVAGAPAKRLRLAA